MGIGGQPGVLAPRGHLARHRTRQTGAPYAGNRHNVGAIVGRLGADPGGVPGPRAVMAVPTTYMNESGGPVAALMSFFSVDVDHVIVVHDELDIDVGIVRLKRGGGEGGHNGLRSVTKSLGTKDHLRVRVGIGRPPGRTDPADYVLHDFSSSERAELPFTLDTAADAVESLVEVGLLESQQRFHAP